MYRSIEHAKFPKFQTGIFVEWKAPFMSTFFSLFCDWSILLGRVDNPMRDDLDIDPKIIEAAVRSSLDNIWPQRFEERVNILFDYVIPG